MFGLYDTVKLKKADLVHGVKSTYLGSIVDVLEEGKAYTVEFVDDAGETVESALLTEYLEQQLELVVPAETK